MELYSTMFISLAFASFVKRQNDRIIRSVMDFFFFLLLTFFLQREVLDDSLTTFPCVQCQYIFLLSLIRRPHVLLQCCQGQATKTTWQRSGESRNYGRIVLKVRNGTQREGLVLPCTCTHPSACAQVVFTSWTNKSVFTINLSEYVQ